MAIERERKFLPDPTDPELAELLAAARNGERHGERRTITQGYAIAAGTEGELRLRENATDTERTRVLTVKRGAPPARQEVEFSITDEQWDALWPLTAGRRIEKTRYGITAFGRFVEIDLFSTPRAGMVLIEIEFDDEESAHAFTPPSWFGREVTTDPAYQNQRLAIG